MDVMSPYARQFTEQLESPDIDRLTGLPPTVAIEQNMSRGGTKSTVGTVTEIWQFMRLLYAKLGQAYCPQCGVPVGKRSESEVVELVARELKNMADSRCWPPSSGDARGITPTWPAGRKERDMRKCGWTANWFP